MSTMSPELALVDPELRADAVARLPAVYANAFLEFPAHATLEVGHQPRTRASAAFAYLVLAVVRTALFEAVLFAAVATVVLVASLLG